MSVPEHKYEYIVMSVPMMWGSADHMVIDPLAVAEALRNMRDDGFSLMLPDIRPWGVLAFSKRTAVPDGERIELVLDSVADELEDIAPNLSTEEWRKLIGVILNCVWT